jgi:hypothetical protein
LKAQDSEAKKDRVSLCWGFYNRASTRISFHFLFWGRNFPQPLEVWGEVSMVTNGYHAVYVNSMVIMLFLFHFFEDF